MRMSGPTDPHRDHVFTDLFAAANAGIVTLADDIRQPVIHRDLDLDVWIVAQKLGEFRQQDCVSRVFGCRDANGPRGLVAKLAQRRQLDLDLLEPRAEGLHEPLARFRWHDPPRGASEQPHAEPLLKLPHAVAQRRLRNAKLGGSPGEAPFPRYGKEGEAPSRWPRCIHGSCS
jgi:hypothetical protein